MEIAVEDLPQANSRPQMASMVNSTKYLRNTTTVHKLSHMYPCQNFSNCIL